MQLFLVQHGQAKTEHEDRERPLTDKGAEEVARVARWVVDEFGVRVARVLHSGKTRARQTAEAWGGMLGADVAQGDNLAPNDDPAPWVERLGGEVDDLMLVGHLPHLGRLTGSLLTGDAERTLVAFRPGGLVELERADGGWTVSLVLPPRRT